MVQVHAVSPGQVGTWIQVQMWSPPLNFTREEWREKRNSLFKKKKKNHIFLKEYKLQSDPDFYFTAVQTILSQDLMSELKCSWLKPSVIPHHLHPLGPANPVPLTAPQRLSFPLIQSVCIERFHAPALCQAPAFQPRCLLPAPQPASTHQGSEHPLLGCFPRKHTHMDTHVHSCTHPSNPQ